MRRLCIDALLVGIVGASLYLNTLSAGFLFDDTVAIRTNADVSEPQRIPAANVWANDFWGRPLTHSLSHKSYRPLTILTFRWTVQLFGHEPWAFHAGNVAIYGVCCFVWTCFVQRLGLLSRGGALAAGLLFAAHPMHVENVAQLVGRADTLGMIFFFLSVWAYLEGARGHGRGLAVRCGWGVAACVLCFASMLSKEVGLLALAVGAGVDVIVVGRALRWETWGGGVWGSPLRGAVLRLVAAGCVSVGFLWWGVWMRGGSASVQGSFIDNPLSFEPSRLSHVLWATEVHAWYLTLLFYPAISCHDWGYNVIPLPTTPWRAACAYAVVFGVPLAALRTEWRERVAVATVLLVIPFVPASHLLKIGTVLAERLLLIPSTGYALGAGVLVDAVSAAAEGKADEKARIGTRKGVTKKMDVKGETPRDSSVGKSAVPLWVWGAVGLVFAWYGGLTVRRNEDWRNPEALYAAGARTCSESAKGWIQVAAEARVQKKPPQDYRHAVEEAVRIYPEYVYGLTLLAELRRETPDELKLLSKAHRVDPSDKTVLRRLATLMLREERHDEAVKFARAAYTRERESSTVLNPNFPKELFRALYARAKARGTMKTPELAEMVDLLDEAIGAYEANEYIRNRKGLAKSCELRVDGVIKLLMETRQVDRATARIRELPKRCVEGLPPEMLQRLESVTGAKVEGV